MGDSPCMSYYTHVSLLRPQPGSPERSTALDGITAYLDELGVSHDVVEDLETLFRTDRKTSIKLYPAHIDAIMKWVSQRQPEIRYVATGKGEDEAVAWTHAYENGVKTVTKEPPKAKVKPKAKPSASAVAAIEAGEGRAYSAKSRFAIGEALEHPSFGKGIVLQVQTDKIVVQFRDGERTLVHGRS